MDNDLISRSALLDCIGDVGNDPEDDTTFLTIGQACAIAHKSIVDMVKAAPAVDAVEVVRCRECKHWNEDALACDTLPWVNSSEHANWYAEDFCSYGVRRANDGK